MITIPDIEAVCNFLAKENTPPFTCTMHHPLEFEIHMDRSIDLWCPVCNSNIRYTIPGKSFQKLDHLSDPTVYRPLLLSNAKEIMAANPMTPFHVSIFGKSRITIFISDLTHGLLQYCYNADPGDLSYRIVHVNTTIVRNGGNPVNVSNGDTVLIYSNNWSSYGPIRTVRDYSDGEISLVRNHELSNQLEIGFVVTSDTDDPWYVAGKNETGGEYQYIGSLETKKTSENRCHHDEHLSIPHQNP